MLPRCVMHAGQAIAQLNCGLDSKSYSSVQAISMAMHCMSHCFGQLPSKMMHCIAIATRPHQMIQCQEICS